VHRNRINDLLNCIQSPQLKNCGGAALGIASDVFIATKGAKLVDVLKSGGDPGVVQLIRAVEPGELQDILNTGVYRTPLGGVEGKYFFPTKAQAENFANMAAKYKQGPYCITSGCIPAGALEGIKQIQVGTRVWSTTYLRTYYPTFRTL